MPNNERVFSIYGNIKENLPSRLEIETLGCLTARVAKNLKYVTVGLCPPYHFLIPLIDIARGIDNFEIGSQNVSHYRHGAHTAEVSAESLKSIGVFSTIIAHSERRPNETAGEIQAKITRALEHGLKPIICFGEPSRENASYKWVIANQLRVTLKKMSPEDILKSVLAYEPVWAIGKDANGQNKKPATPEDVIEVIEEVVLEELEKLFGHETATEITLIYGGNVRPDNIKGFLRIPYVYGALVGGSTNDPEKFCQILQGTEEEAESYYQ